MRLGRRLSAGIAEDPPAAPGRERAVPSETVADAVPTAEVTVEAVGEVGREYAEQAADR